MQDIAFVYIDLYRSVVGEADAATQNCLHLACQAPKDSEHARKVLFYEESDEIWS